MAEEREVIARLKVEKEGDTGAFSETSDEIKDLAAQTDASRARLKEFSESTKDAGESAGEAGENIDDMGESARGAGSKLGDISGKAVAMAAAFKAGWEAGSVLRDVMNDLTKGGFDRGIQDMATSAINFFTSLDDGGDAALRLQNGMNILKKNGIDPVGLSAEQVAAKIEELSRKKNQAAADAKALSEAEEEWAAKLGLSGKALDESSKKLATYIADFAKQNSQLSATDLGKIFGPMIQEVLDGYARLGKEAPPEVKKLADGWGVLTTAAQKAANEQSKIVDQMVEDINGAAKGLKGSLEAQLKTLNDVFSKLDFGSMGAEQIEKSKQFLQEYVDTSRKAGQQIPKDVADQSASLGILVSAMEVAAEGSTGLATEQGKVGGAAQGSATAYDAATRSLKTLEGEVATSTVAFDKSTGVMKTVGTEVGKATVEYDKATGTLRTVETAHSTLGAAAKTAGGDVKEGATKAGEGKQALEEAGKAAGDAGTGLDAAKRGAEGLGAAGDAAKTAATNIKTPLGEVGTAAGEAATALGSIETTIGRLNSLNLSGLVTSLKAVETQARTTKAAIDAIDGDGGAEPAASPTGGDPGGSGGGGGGGF